MPRRATGTVQWVGDPDRPLATDHFKARLRLPNPADPTKPLRPWVELPAGLTLDQAKVKAAELQALARAEHYRPAPKFADVPTARDVETVREWFERWIAARKKRGRKSSRTIRSRAETWILPRLGSRPMARVTRAEIEAWVEWIDDEVLAEHLGWRTATHAWTTLTKMFKDARVSKTVSLRLRTDNPTVDVLPPERGVSKAKQFLYPSEVTKLLGCADVPLALRRTYAVAVYLYPRTGEIEALHREDLDLDHASVQLHRAMDPETGVIHETKGRAARRVALEPELVPLLRGMFDETPEAVRLFEPYPLARDRARQLRSMLQRAGVTRRELYVTDATRTQITLHDLRATGITWAAVRGDAPLQIMYRAGHKDLETTLDYVRLADGVRGSFGVPFPPLPEALLGVHGEGFGPGSVSGGGGVSEERRAEGVSRQRGEIAEFPPGGFASTDSSRFPAFGAGDSPTIGRDRSESVAPKDRSGTDPAPPTTPRLALLRATLTAIGEMIEEGDLAGARIAEESLRQLLGAEAPAPVEARPGVVTTGRGRP